METFAGLCRLHLFICMLYDILLCRLNQKLELLEADCGITKRWDPTHPKYIEYVRSQASEALEHSKSSLRSCVAKRQFLLKLKAKYAGTFSPIIYIIMHHSFLFVCFILYRWS